MDRTKAADEGINCAMKNIFVEKRNRDRGPIVYIRRVVLILGSGNGSVSASLIRPMFGVVVGAISKFASLYNIALG
jgi:hypothetical protein